MRPCSQEVTEKSQSLISVLDNLKDLCISSAGADATGVGHTRTVFATQGNMAGDGDNGPPAGAKGWFPDAGRVLGRLAHCCIHG